MNHTTLTLAATLLLTACGSAKKAQMVGGQTAHAEADTTQAVTRQYDLADQLDMIQSNNDFALRLYNGMEGMESNVVSPLSVTFLMSMLANGADGSTLREIQSTLGWQGKPLDEINALCRMEMERASTSDPKVEVSVANFLAVNKTATLLDSYKSVVADAYKAGVESLDFALPTATSRINGWCSDHTGGMIPKIVDRVSPSDMGYIINAIYFNGTWTHKFDKAQTVQERFKGYTRDIKTVPMMHQNSKFQYVSNGDFAAVSLPYGKRNYCMTVILPNEDKSLAEVMGAFSAKSLSALFDGMDECIVDLKLPRFTAETDLQLNELVGKLGAPSIFKASVADFSKLAKGRMFISQMIQKAKIEVGEEGTRAAAVTTGVLVGASLGAREPRKVTFHANRPFAYIITDACGAIVFMGRYVGDGSDS